MSLNFIKRFKSKVSTVGKSGLLHNQLQPKIKDSQSISVDHPSLNYRNASLVIPAFEKKLQRGQPLLILPKLHSLRFVSSRNVSGLDRHLNIQNQRQRTEGRRGLQSPPIKKKDFKKKISQRIQQLKSKLGIDLTTNRQSQSLRLIPKVSGSNAISPNDSLESSKLQKSEVQRKSMPDKGNQRTRGQKLEADPYALVFNEYGKYFSLADQKQRDKVLRHLQFLDRVQHKKIK